MGVRLSMFTHQVSLDLQTQTGFSQYFLMVGVDGPHPLLRKKPQEVNLDPDQFTTPNSSLYMRILIGRNTFIPLSWNRLKITSPADNSITRIQA